MNSSAESQSHVLINGVAADYISVDDRAIQFGDGLFETMLVKDGVILQRPRHLERLLDSARRLGIECPAISLLDMELDTLVEENTLDHAVIKIILSRGSSTRGYQYDTHISSTRVIRSSPVDVSYSSLLSGELLSGDLYCCETQISNNRSLAGMKHLNRLENVLARHEFDGQRFIDGIMSDMHGNVIECSTSNLFGVREGHLYTPDLSTAGVKGVMRDTILELANTMDMTVSVTDFSLDELKTMDCLFITNSVIGMKTVIGLDGVSFHDFGLCEQLFDGLMHHIEARH